MKNKIAVLGSGQVAKTLANGFLKHGYEVTMGTRDRSKLNEWKSAGGDKAHTGSFDEAASWGETIVLAVKGKAAEQAITRAGIKNLNNKTVIDVTNPIDDAPPVNGVIKFFTSLDESLMERLQRAAPNVHFVKAFCSVGNAYMVNPQFPAGKPTMFICGNNDDAKKEVSEIVNKFGHEVEDMGKAEGARAIEPLCILWCIPGMLRNQWSHAFKLLKM